MRFNIEYYTRWGENLFLRNGCRRWPMNYVADGRWSVEIAEAEFFSENEAKGGCVEYYYEVERNSLPVRHEWRVHILAKGAAEQPAQRVIEDSWSDPTGWKGAGCAVPLFALRSDSDFGVGEFSDIRLLVDWAVATGQSFVQLLPVNDTTCNVTIADSYPYNAISAFALHPQYINLPEAGVEVGDEYLALQRELNAFATENGRPQVDYERVNREKLRLLKGAYRAKGVAQHKTLSYRNFLSANAQWLKPYAVFCVLRDRFGTADFSQWGGWATYDAAAVEQICKECREEVGFVFFVQYNLHAQFAAARNYAHSKGVYLKGDLPIGVSRNSVDVWQWPHLFNTTQQAGAPPDAFACDGQNWGFPTYNWDAMAKDGYAWWKARLGKLQEYFDAIRIDHILGFFRIWEIPFPLKSGLEGHFNPALPYPKKELASLGYASLMHKFVEDPYRRAAYHPRIDATDLGGLHEDFFFCRHNEMWKRGALGKLSALVSSTRMLVCGEDLGMIPECVPEVMSALGILSLEIQRMPKEYGRLFADPLQYGYNSVCTTSTHDMNPLRAWWLEDRGLTQRYYNEMLGGEGDAPEQCEPWICRKIIERHLASPSMLVILPIQDWLALDSRVCYGGDPSDERINVPANPRHHWDYRMHISLEQLLAETAFNAEVASLVKKSGRIL